MAKVVSYVFDSLFERKETISYREKRTVVITFFAFAIAITTALSFIAV